MEALDHRVSNPRTASMKICRSKDNTPLHPDATQQISLRPRPAIGLGKDSLSGARAHRVRQDLQDHMINVISNEDFLLHKRELGSRHQNGDQPMQGDPD